MTDLARIVFMGTPDFAIPALRVLHDLHDQQIIQLCGIVTQPDRPVGRKRKLTAPPVKQEALNSGIPILQPEKIRDPEVEQIIKNWQPHLVITAAFGQILSESLLQIPALGCVNLHASLLPKYRGGAPIQHAILNGDQKTGITLMYMDIGLDTGDIIAVEEVEIAINDNSGTLFAKLSDLSAQILKKWLPALLKKEVIRLPQDHQNATYAPNISQQMERIDWTQSAIQVHNLVRALSPWPVAYTLWNGHRLKIAETKISNAKYSNDALPGHVQQANQQGFIVKCGTGAIELIQIQPFGKKMLLASDFLRGSSMMPGTLFGKEMDADE